MHVVIFTGGEFIDSSLSRKARSDARLLIAADSGAITAVKLGIFPSVVIGDLDSLDKKTKKFLEDKKTNFHISPEKKDETDTELAIDYAIKQGATRITLFGGISGNRFDHIIANLLLPVDLPIPITLINGNQVSWISKGNETVQRSGKIGDLLSLIPLSKDVKNITTSGLEYPLKNQSLLFGKARGVSNVFVDKHVSITLGEGILLFVHTVLGN